MVETIVKNRRYYVSKMFEQGMSVQDMAKFFQISPRFIRLSLKRNNTPFYEKVGIGYEKVEEISEILNKHALEVSSNKFSLNDYGLLEKPQIGSQYKTIADDWIKEHKDDEILVSIFSGTEPKQVAFAVGTTHCLLKRSYQRKNIDLNEVYKLGIDYRSKQSMYKIWELKTYGFAPNDIQSYLNISNQEYQKAIKYAKENNIDITEKSKKLDLEKIKKILLSGETLNNVSEAFGIDNKFISPILQTVVKEQQGENTELKKYSYKEEKRRALIFTLYTKDLLTQQEIADRLNICRSTVVTDLQTYRKDHPEEVDKTYLWRQRNLSCPTKALRINKKGLTIKLYKSGLTIKNIEQITKIRENSIRNYLGEDGLLQKSEPHKKIEKNRYNIWKYTQQGYSKEQIAETLGLKVDLVERTMKQNEKCGEPLSRRAEELKLSWSGFTTTEISQIVGRHRATVLNDQHKTANKLRNDDNSYQFVKEHAGDITKEELDKEII